MNIPEIKDILEKNCGDDVVLMEATKQFFNIENSNDARYNERYDEVIKKYYDRR